MKSYKEIAHALDAQRPEPKKTVADLVRSPIGEGIVGLLLVFSDFNAYYAVLNVVLLQQAEWMVMLVTLAASALTMVLGLCLGRLLAYEVPAQVRKRLWVGEVALIVVVVALLIAANCCVRVASMNGMIDDPTQIDNNAETLFMGILLVASLATAVIMAVGHPAPTKEDAQLVAAAQLEALHLARARLSRVAEDPEGMEMLRELDAHRCEAAKAQVDTKIPLYKEKARVALMRLIDSDAPEVIFNAEYATDRADSKND